MHHVCRHQAGGVFLLDELPEYVGVQEGCEIFSIAPDDPRVGLAQHPGGCGRAGCGRLEAHWQRFTACCLVLLAAALGAWMLRTRLVPTLCLWTALVQPLVAVASAYWLAGQHPLAGFVLLQGPRGGG